MPCEERDRGPTGAWKPGREVDLGCTFKQDVWEGKIQLACAGRAQDHLLGPRETPHHTLQLPPPEAACWSELHCGLERGWLGSHPLPTSVKWARQRLLARAVRRNTHNPVHKGSGWQEACSKMLQTWIFLSIPCVSPTGFVQSFMALVSRSSSWEPVGRDVRGTSQTVPGTAGVGCATVLPATPRGAGRPYPTPRISPPTHTLDPARSWRSQTGNTLLTMGPQVRTAKETTFVEH